MLIPEEVIDKVRESNDILDVISEHVSLKKKGRNYVGLCPFHKEKTPSFMVQQDRQTFHCFGCGEGGNVISFIMKYRSLEFVDAVKMLAERANILIPESGEQVNSEKINLINTLYRINKEAAKYFFNNLKENNKAFEYFKSRGISGEIIKRFGLGYSQDRWDGLLKHLSSMGFKEELMEQAGLIIRKEGSRFYDRFRNRVMFPVFDVRGRVIGFGGRVLDDSKPKYLNSPETLVFNKGNNLYGLNIASKRISDRRIIIVEGYMDAIALHQYGIENAVASLGTALTMSQAKLLKRYGDEVIISYDSDTAGQAATLRGLDILSKAGCVVKILGIPKGKDPDEFIRAEGKDEFLKCIDNAEPLVEYKIRRKSESFDTTTTEGKIGFIKSAAEALIEIENPIVVDAYINKLSMETGIGSSALYDELSRQRSVHDKSQTEPEKHISGKSRYNNIIDGQKLYLEPAYIKAERFILCALYKDVSLFKYFEGKLSSEDFNDNAYKKVARIIFECLENNLSIIPASIISKFDNGEDMKKVADIFNDGMNIDMNGINDVLEDYIRLIGRHKLICMNDQLKLELRESEQKGDVEQSARLLEKIIEIEKKLRMH
jgi:DNA primase